MKKPWWQSTTILGAILAAAANVAGANPGDRVKAVFESAGVIVAAVGARQAIAKNGQGE